MYGCSHHDDIAGYPVPHLLILWQYYEDIQYTVISIHYLYFYSTLL